MSDRIEIIKELRALEKFCAFPANLTGEDRERFLKDYLADIERHSLPAIQKACGKWRQCGSTKFPTPGQLIPLIQQAEPVEHVAGARPWAPAGQSEFAGMSVREKIRELTILAHKERLKAGPMFRNATLPGSRKISGKHLTLEEMPESYHRHTAEAKRIEGEIGRLRGVLRTPFQQAAE